MRLAVIASIMFLGQAACDKAPTPPTPAAQVSASAPANPAAPADPSADPSHPQMGSKAHDPAAPSAGMAPGPVDPAAALPPGHPPVAQAGPNVPAPGAPANPMAATVAAETGVERPLPLEGSGSLAELRARLAKIKDTSKHATLEDAFRKVFTIDRANRDNPGAEAILMPLAKDPDPAVAALAERAWGLVRVNSGFDQEGAKAHYARAIELDPEYGEAHYAMAFMLAMGDRTQGKVHFDKAMALGVPDNRGLREQFYGAQ